MKEISIEEKAKRYDEAIKEASDAYKDEDRHLKATLESIFPELKESEDEQSKTWILEYLYDGLRKSDEQFKGEFKAAIDWLKKQGKKERDARYKYLEELFEADTIYQMAMNDAMGEEAKAKALEAISNIEIFELLGFEKKQKSIDIDVESMVSSYKQRLKNQGAIENTPLLNLPLAAYRRGVENVLEELNLKKLKKQDNVAKEVTCTQEVKVGNGNLKALVTEEIPIDNVEPKFKIGDWITIKE